MNILSFSGFIPEHICDTERFIQYQGTQKISHYCGYAADYISRVLEDPAVDGAVFPRSCDSSRSMAGYLSGCGEFLFQLHVPARQDESAARYLADNIQRYQQAVETHYGITLSDIPERIALVNRRNQAIAKLYEDILHISYQAYLDMLHQLLRLPLREQNVSDNLPGSAEGKRVYLVGSLLSNSGVVSAIEGAGMKIAGDRLSESKRLFSASADTAEGDVYINIARSMLQTKLSPTQGSFHTILQEDLEEIREKQVRGVIFVTQKFCEPYDYLYYVYKKQLDKLQIPMLHLVLSSSTDAKVFEASLEAFSDIL